MLMLVVSDTSDRAHLGQKPSLAERFVAVSVATITSFSGLLIEIDICKICRLPKLGPIDDRYGPVAFCALKRHRPKPSLCLTGMQRAMRTKPPEAWISDIVADAQVDPWRDKVAGPGALRSGGVVGRLPRGGKLRPLLPVRSADALAHISQLRSFNRLSSVCVSAAVSDGRFWRGSVRAFG